MIKIQVDKDSVAVSVKAVKPNQMLDEILHLVTTAYNILTESLHAPSDIVLGLFREHLNEIENGGIEVTQYSFEPKGRK